MDITLLTCPTTSHKRSKSALAFSLLHRDKSKGEDGADDTTSNDGSSAQSSGSPVIGPSLSPLGHSRSDSHRRFMQEPNLPPPSSEGPPQSTSSNQGGDNIEKAASAQGESAPMSLDQSVRTFRLFEVLRSGDTSAISKAIKETKDGQGVNALVGTTILHLAIQCAEPQVVEYVL